MKKKLDISKMGGYLTIVSLVSSITQMALVVTQEVSCSV